MSQDQTTSVEEPETYDIEENQDERASKWPAIGVALAVLWLFVRGVHFIDEPGLAAGEFIIGLAVGLPIAYAIRGIYAPTYGLRRSLSVLPAAGIYLGLFLWELVTANIDVARRVLSPSMPIDPSVVEVPLRVESAVAITTIANSITLTPGALTMDHDEETNTLYVHAIDGRDPEAILSPIRRWEDYALVIFDEERKPGDPVPTRGGETGGE